MASTIKLIDTVEWAKKFNFGRRSAIGNELEPAKTSANLVKQTMLGPPFGWFWNSEEIEFNCDASQENPQDYEVSVPKFSWIEHANVQDITVPTDPKWIELQAKTSLALDSSKARPRFISPHTQDTEGNVVFRVMPVPNLDYPVSMHVQFAPTLFTSLDDTWEPIPDHLSYIYNWGFLAMMWLFADDPRFTIANQKFVAHLLGTHDGLDEVQRNIFLNNWDAITGSQNMQKQQAVQARSV